MLEELRLSSVGGIAHAALKFGAGLIAVTGESGAGKSSLVRGLEMVCGKRSSSSTIRAGDETAIAEAKAVLAKKGATYRNLTFASGSEAGVLTGNVFAFPTTHVVDQKGNIVGDPIVGAITEKKQAETLNKLIEQAIANSKA